MTRKPIEFFQAVLTSTAAALLTAVNGTRTINACTVSNPTAGTLDLTVYLVPASASADATTTVLPATPIGPGATLQIGQVMAQHVGIGGTLQAKGSADGLVMTGSSYETI